MISILLMTVFSETDPMVSTPGKKDTTLFARVLTGQQFDQAGTTTTPAVLDAVASVKKAEDDGKAQTYFNDLTDARSAPAVQGGKTTVGQDDKIGQFTISHFKKSADNVLLKFWKTATDGARTVLACVIDRASVGLKETENVTAKMMKASWLNYFWNLWNGRDETFKDANFTTITDKKMTDFSLKTYSSGIKDPDSGFPRRPYGEFKGFIPRTWTVEQANKATQDGKAARKVEISAYIPTLLRIKNQGLNLEYFIQLLQERSLKLLKELCPEGLTENNLWGQFNKDVNRSDSPSEGHKLNREFWAAIWNETFLPMARTQLSEDEADARVNATLTKMEKIAKNYKPNS